MMDIEQLVGQTAARLVTIDAEMVQRFADLAGDHNPLHLDAATAQAGRFGKPVAHGMLVASLFSGIIGEELPGPGAIYLSQTIEFSRPVFVGQTITARVVVIETDLVRRRARLGTSVTDQDGSTCVSGEAWVLVS